MVGQACNRRGCAALCPDSSSLLLRDYDRLDLILDAV